MKKIAKNIEMKHLPIVFNHTIKKITLSDDKLNIKFNDSIEIEMFDNQQSCCEHRYMHTDDDLKYYKGALFLNAEVSLSNTEDESGVVECRFLKIKTSKGDLTIANYNSHNGYYGGFDIIINLMIPKTKTEADEAANTLRFYDIITKCEPAVYKENE